MLTYWHGSHVAHGLFVADEGTLAIKPNLHHIVRGGLS